MLVIFAHQIIRHLTGFANIPLQRNNHAGYFYTIFKKKKKNENNGKLYLYISKKAGELKQPCYGQTFDNGDKLGLLQPFLTNLYHF